MEEKNKNYLLVTFLLGIFLGFFFGFYIFKNFNLAIEKYFQNFPILKIERKQSEKIPTPSPQEYLPQTSQEEKVIEIVKKRSPAVVSIVITKDLPLIEEYWREEFFGPFRFRIPEFRERGFEKKEVGGGTGFFISSDGLILTNNHVVSDKEADYTVVTIDSKKYSAKVLVRDQISDLALLSIEGTNFPYIPLGNSDNLQIGQTVIAIGNALGEFKNTVSVGVISGLGRQITAEGGGVVTTQEDVIQTDAAINRGNSGGPLLNLKGEAIGVNFAMAIGAENIGFAIPINKAKKLIEQYRKYGKVVYPFLGIRYIIVDEEIQKEMNLPVDYGALILRGEKGESAIFPGSAAEKAGLREGDIVLEFNGEKIIKENPLAKIIMKYKPGDKVSLRVLREGKEITFEVILGERSEE